ncbi:MAG: hypothetical protein FWG40_00485 [Peptococcaceae bacterium]|nr:hypothetical protein [Peptococcaceae bacterium]
MTKFEPGKRYQTRSICDHNCIYTILVLDRTDKTIVFSDDGRIRRSKIRVDKDGEYLIPDRYSMAPVYRAHRDHVKGF